MKILIFVNDSLGELDWISPFIKSQEGKEFEFYIFIYGPGKNYEEKYEIIKKYQLYGENIRLLNTKGAFDNLFFNFDNFLNKIANRVKGGRKIFDKIKLFLSYFYSSEKIKFDFLFRDYNLKDTIIFNSYLEYNKMAKVIIYPHAVGIQKFHEESPREIVKKVRADLWLENSTLSDLVKKQKIYENIFCPVGVPSFDINCKAPSLFNTKSKNILIITRDCGLTYGFTYTEAFDIFNKLLHKFQMLDLNVYIKHHPRDKKLSEWQNIQKKYENTEELTNSLNNLEDDYLACFSLYSTAPLLLISRGVPIFEFSPYKNYEAYARKFPFHFKSNSGMLTHDLLDLNLYEHLCDVEKVSDKLDEDYLNELSKQQFERFIKVFPLGANQNLKNELLGLVDGS